MSAITVIGRRDFLKAGAGLLLIGWHGNQPGAWGGHFGVALSMVVLAAAMWAVANVLARRLGSVGAVRLLVWSSLASPSQRCP